MSSSGPGGLEPGDFLAPAHLLTPGIVDEMNQGFLEGNHQLVGESLPPGLRPNAHSSYFTFAFILNTEQETDR